MQSIATAPRKATHSDAQAILNLRNEAIRVQCAGFYDPDLLAQWAHWTTPSDAFIAIVAERFQIIEHDGDIVASGMVDLENGKIDAIFVSPSHGRQGLGRAMMAHLEAMARTAGLGSLHLESTLNAAPFYRTLGFTGETRSTYQSPRGFELDCILMSKALI